MKKTLFYLAAFIAVFSAIPAWADVIIPPGVTIRYLLTSFSPNPENNGGLYIFGGSCPTNLTSIDYSSPGVAALVFVATNRDFRDSSMIQIGQNYYVIFNDEGPGNCPIIKLSNSTNQQEDLTMTNWTYQSLVTVPSIFGTLWSPKWVTDDQGNIFITAFVQGVSDGNYYMGVGTMTTNLDSIQNFNVMTLSRNPASNQTDPNSSAVYFHNHLFYLFTGDGNEYVSANILANTWHFLTNGLPYSAGKTVAEWQGMFYLDGSELGSQNWAVSADLTNWTSLYLPDSVTPYLGEIGREGCFFEQLIGTVPASAVTLNIAPTTGNTLTISWANVGDYTLEQSTNLASGSWTTNTLPVVSVNAVDYVNLPQHATGNLFFRLIQ